MIDGKKLLTTQNLPIVSNQTIDAIYQIYTGKKWGKHLNEVRKHLLLSNPNLVKFIENQVGKYPPAVHDAMFEVVIGTLAVLRLQGLLDEKKREKGDK